MDQARQDVTVHVSNPTVGMVYEFRDSLPDNLLRETR